MKASEVLLFLFFAGIGVVCLAAGLVNYNQEEHFFATAEQATGTITDYAYVGRSNYCPLIEFTPRGGHLEQYVNSADCASGPDSSRFGQQVQVYFDPEKPSSTTQVRGWLGTEGTGLIAGAAGCAFFPFIGLIVALSILLRRRRADAKAIRQQAPATTKAK